MRSLVPAIIIAAIPCALACAFSNEGAVDLRRTTHDPSVQNPPNELPLSAKNFSMGPNKRIVAGDSLHVSLRSAYIKHFFEVGTNVFRGFQANGEIAVVANAFEAETGKEIDFVNMRTGRLVFFSDDVQQGQFLNMNNLPIYGPKTYTGQPFATRLTIFELDGGSEESRSLLNALAQAGSTAYPPASPVLTLLNSVGQALIDDDPTDTEFRYAFQLNARPGSPFVRSFDLEVGNYVLVRSKDRTKPIPWDELVLEENEGRLYWKGSNGDQPHGEPYTDNTYIVLEFNTGGSARDIDLKQNTFQELQQALDEQDRKAAARIAEATTPLLAAVKTAVLRRNQSTNFDAAKVGLDDLESPSASEVRKREGAARTLLLLSASLTPTGALKDPNPEEGEPRLSDQQVDYLITRLRTHAGAAQFEALGRASLSSLDRAATERLAEQLAAGQPPGP